MATIINFRPDLFRIQASLVHKFKNPDTNIQYYVGSQSRDEVILKYIKNVCRQFNIKFWALPEELRYWDAQAYMLKKLESLDRDLAWFMEEDMVPTGPWENFDWPIPACSYWVGRPRFQLMCWNNNVELDPKTINEIPSYRGLIREQLPKHLQYLKNEYNPKTGMQFFGNIWLHYDKGSYRLDEGFRWFMDAKDNFLWKLTKDLGGSVPKKRFSQIKRNVTEDELERHQKAVAKANAKIKPKGLGDRLAKVTKAVGIKPCGGCEKRRDVLNKIFPYS